MTARQNAVDTRTLQVEDAQGTFRITIPADYKVTFSGFNQGGKYPDGTAALRIYEAENKQRACFKGVYSFFDVSLPIEREVIEEFGETTWVSGPDGFQKAEKVSRKRVKAPY